jgi:hypothetical protein
MIDGSTVRCPPFSFRENVVALERARTVIIQGDFYETRRVWILAALTPEIRENTIKWSTPIQMDRMPTYARIVIRTRSTTKLINSSNHVK